MDEMTDAELKNRLQRILVVQRVTKLSTFLYSSDIPVDNLTAVALRLAARQIEISCSTKVTTVDEMATLAKKIVDESEVELNFLLSELK